MTRYFINRDQVSAKVYAAHLAKSGVILKQAGLLKKAQNITGAAGRVVKSLFYGNKVLVSDDEQIRRMGICQVCEFFTGSTCQKCGCHIRFKAKLQTEHCPITKW